MASQESDGRGSPLKATLEALVPGARVDGVTGSGPVTVVNVEWIGIQAVTLTSRDVHGRTGQVIMGPDREPSLTILTTGDGPGFDADPAW